MPLAGIQHTEALSAEPCRAEAHQREGGACRAEAPRTVFRLEQERLWLSCDFCAALKRAAPARRGRAAV